jgi:hypothetical protein
MKFDISICIHVLGAQIIKNQAYLQKKPKDKKLEWGKKSKQSDFHKWFKLSTSKHREISCLL